MSNKVVMEQVEVTKEGNHSQSLCAGEVDGAVPYYHTIAAGNAMEFAANLGFFHILMLIEGRATFATAGKTYGYGERVAFVPALDQALTVTAETDAQILEIQWLVAADDHRELAEYRTVFPLIQTYAAAKQYRDRNKSDKTISRVIIEQRNIPRFCMGSVESYGYDIVKPHGHPMLDQFFFSFPENEMDVLIDGGHFPMSGNILLHIPLGADHGVEVFDANHLHYMWIDFMVDKTAMKRLDTSHIATGTMRSFDQEGQ